MDIHIDEVTRRAILVSLISQGKKISEVGDFFQTLENSLEEELKKVNIKSFYFYIKKIDLSSETKIKENQIILLDFYTDRFEFFKSQHDAESLSELKELLEKYQQFNGLFFGFIFNELISEIDNELK